MNKRGNTNTNAGKRQQPRVKPNSPTKRGAGMSSMHNRWNENNNDGDEEEYEDMCLIFCGLHDESFWMNEENLDSHYWQA